MSVFSNLTETSAGDNPVQTIMNYRVEPDCTSNVELGWVNSTSSHGGS